MVVKSWAGIRILLKNYHPEKIMKHSRGFVGVILLIASILVAGCGPKGPDVVPVSGTVTKNGKPVPGLFINFEPGNGRPSWAQTDSEGKFVVKYDATMDGAKVGTHKVWFIWKPVDPKDQMIEEGFVKGKSSKTPEVREILKKYGDVKTSPLSIEIKQATPNLEIKLD